MPCPKCNFINPEGTLFCSNCGSPLTPLAPSSQQNLNQASQPNPTPVTATPPVSTNNNRRTIVIVLSLAVLILIVGALWVVSRSKLIRLNNVKTNNSLSFSSPKINPTSDSNNLTFSIVNNYEKLSKLNTDEENKLGVITPPPTAKKVDSYNGIDILDTQSRRFKPGEVDTIKKTLSKIPKKYLETPPKAIISMCCDELKSITPPNVALASGPYIILNDNFFQGNILSGSLSENEKLTGVMHEITHVIQYYRIHDFYLEKGSVAGNLSDYSSLVFDYAKKVGWTRKDSSANSDENNPNYFSNGSFWKLKSDDASQKTTDYGRTSPQEDHADSSGMFMAGQYQLLSQSRIDYISNFLGQPPTDFSKGIVPIYPGCKRGSFSYDKFLKTQTDSIQSKGKKLTDKVQWLTTKTENLQNIIDYYKKEFVSRSFAVEQDIKSTKLTQNEDYVYGTFNSENKTYLFTVLDFRNANGYSVKPEQPIITVLTFE